MLNSMGVYKTAVQNSDGSVTYYTHDKPTLDESSYINCETSNGFAYTNNGWNNGSPHWQYGTTKDGNVICNVLAAVGIVADWIKAGRIESKDGSCYFDLDNNRLVASEIGMSDSHYATIGSFQNGPGIALYNKSLSEAPYFVVQPSAGDIGFSICDVNEQERLWCTDIYTSLKNRNGDAFLYSECLADGTASTLITSGSSKGNYDIIVSDYGITFYGPNGVIKEWT